MAFPHPPCTPFDGFSVHSLLGGGSWTRVKAAPGREQEARGLRYEGLCKARAGAGHSLQVREGEHTLPFGKSGGSQSIQPVSPHGVVTTLKQRQSAIISAETV